VIPVGPVKIGIEVPDGVRGSAVKMLVSNAVVRATRDRRWVRLTIPTVSDHEVLVIE
jgi:hypothetical protein